MGKVRFLNADTSYKMMAKKKLSDFIHGIFNEEEKYLNNIDYIFCTDDYLLDINVRFLQHDFYTDIITFDLTEEADKGISGEVYVSIDRVKDNAFELKCTIKKELHRVLFHGALHLCGYKDKKKSEITIMREKEDYYLHCFEKISSNA